MVNKVTSFYTSIYIELSPLNQNILSILIVICYLAILEEVANLVLKIYQMLYVSTLIKNRRNKCHLWFHF